MSWLNDMFKLKLSYETVLCFGFVFHHIFGGLLLNNPNHHIKPGFKPSTKPNTKPSTKPSTEPSTRGLVRRAESSANQSNLGVLFQTVPGV
jgi:hypothetical protein